MSTAPVVSIKFDAAALPHTFVVTPSALTQRNPYPGCGYVVLRKTPQPDRFVAVTGCRTLAFAYRCAERSGA